MFEEFWANRHRNRIWDTVAYATPAALFVLLFVAYLASPDFYHKYLLEHVNREYQFVELATFVFAILAAVLLAFAATWLWRSTARARKLQLVPVRSGPAGLGDGRGSALIVSVIGLATFFLAMEEINWGQTFTHWGAPDTFKSTATNLHNNIHYVQGLGALFIIVSLWLLPLLWALRRKLRVVPADWAPAVPELAVAIAVVVAFVPAEWKEIYRSMHHDFEQRPFYMGYLEEIKEQKEMLMALALLIYAAYRVMAASSFSRLVSAKASAGATGGGTPGGESKNNLTP